MASMVTAQDVRIQTTLYLDGQLDLDAFVDWVIDHSMKGYVDGFQDVEWRVDGANSKSRTLPSLPQSAIDMIETINMMDSEMTCSGSFRTEAMFQADLRSMLDGKPMTAFTLDWDAYMQWCKQREADVARHLV